jgi:hypothetical protein
VNSTSELDSYTNGIRRSLLSDVIQQQFFNFLNFVWPSPYRYYTFHLAHHFITQQPTQASSLCYSCFLYPLDFYKSGNMHLMYYFDESGKRVYTLKVR